MSGKATQSAGALPCLAMHDKAMHTMHDKAPAMLLYRGPCHASRLRATPPPRVYVPLCKHQLTTSNMGPLLVREQDTIPCAPILMFAVIPRSKALTSQRRERTAKWQDQEGRLCFRATPLLGLKDLFPPSPLARSLSEHAFPSTNIWTHE